MKNPQFYENLKNEMVFMDEIKKIYKAKEKQKNLGI